MANNSTIKSTTTLSQILLGESPTEKVLVISSPAALPVTSQIIEQKTITSTLTADNTRSTSAVTSPIITSPSSTNLTPVSSPRPDFLEDMEKYPMPKYKRKKNESDDDDVSEKSASEKSASESSDKNTEISIKEGTEKIKILRKEQISGASTRGQKKKKKCSMGDCQELVSDSTFKVCVQLPPRQDRLKEMRYFYDNITNTHKPIIMCIDGSEQEVQKSEDKSLDEFHYSGKKAKHTLTILLACSPTGKIYYLSQSYPGSINDQTTFNLAQLHKKVPHDECMLLDAGFAHVEGYDNVIVSLKKPQNGELTDVETNYNNNIKKVRIVVENVFSLIKKWSICRDVLRVNVTDGTAEQLHNKVWTIVAALHNEYGEQLRSADV